MQVQAFLSGATATDNVDGDLTEFITNNAPAQFPFGDTVLMFSVTASATNTGTAQATLTVIGPDFKTHLVKMIISGGTNSVVTSTFDAVDPSRMVALVAGIMQHAMGWTEEIVQAPDEISAHVSLDETGSTLK